LSYPLEDNAALHIWAATFMSNGTEARYHPNFGPPKPPSASPDDVTAAANGTSSIGECLRGQPDLLRDPAIQRRKEISSKKPTHTASIRQSQPDSTLISEWGLLHKAGKKGYLTRPNCATTPYQGKSNHILNGA
jgi:hypothetical protein